MAPLEGPAAALLPPGPLRYCRGGGGGVYIPPAPAFGFREVFVAHEKQQREAYGMDDGDGSERCGRQGGCGADFQSG